MKLLFTILSFLVISTVSGQQRQDIANYIKQYKHIVIEEMVLTKIPERIIMAQGILESGCAKSALSNKANTHFRIKCKSEWTGKTSFQDDDEAQECLRVYEH